MKKYSVFFPSAQLNIWGRDEKETFYLGLLAYDTIYTRTFHLESLKNKELFKDKDSLLEVDENGNTIDLNTYSLAVYYLNGDLDTIRKLIKEKIVQNIYSLLCFNDNFIDDVFWHYIDNNRYSIFPCAELFLFIYNELCNKYPETVVRKDVERIRTLLSDLIISEYYKKTYGVNTIYSYGHVMILDMLKRMPTFAFLDEDIKTISGEDYDLPLFFSNIGIKKYYKNTSELFKFSGVRKDKTIKLLFSEVLPDITELPVKTIYDAKRKDKFKTLPLLAENLSISKDISNEDLVKYFDEAVWKFANSSLRISASEVIFNILGQVSIEPFNTAVQIFSQSNDLFGKISDYKHNGWIIPILELKEEIKRRK